MESDLYCSKCGSSLKSEEIEHGDSGSEQPTAILHEKPVPANRNATLQYKGVGVRLIAQIFDSIPLLILYFIAGNIIASIVGGSTVDGFELQGTSALGLMLLMLLCSILYFTLLESWWDGQSLGKKILRIQVVNMDGSRIPLSSSFMRNALRVVDGFLFYLVGALFIWRSRTKQRLGDRMAGTVVIKKVSTEKSSPKRSKLVFGEKDPSMIDTFD